jgi:hypothetical protein
VSLWAAVPTYVSGPSSPVAALALLRRIEELLSMDVPVGDLEQEATDYRRRIDEIVEDDDDLQGFLRRLESAYDEEGDEDADPAAFIEEVERFLRDQQ